VERKKFRLPVIIKNPKEVWDKILSQKENYPESFLEKLPGDKWMYEESLQQNEMFVLGMTKEDFERSIKENNKAELSKYLYRVQKMASSDYWFRHHLETELTDTPDSKKAKRFIRIQSIAAFINENPIKVKIDRLGDISFFTKE
jgi:CRISPR-associated endonuclease Csn1